MYEIKAHEVIYRGAHFRSKNECKRYIFLKELGWNVEYEPILDDIKGWQPDFIIFGKTKKILVEAKPYQTLKGFGTEYAKSVETKIHNTGWYNNYDAVIIVGSTLNLGQVGSEEDDSFKGGVIFRTDNYQKEEYAKGTHNHVDKGKGPYYEDTFVYTDRDTDGEIDICDEEMSFHGVVWDSYDGGYYLSKKAKDKIETAWNKAGTEMRYVKRIT